MNKFHLGIGAVPAAVLGLLASCNKGSGPEPTGPAFFQFRPPDQATVSSTYVVGMDFLTAPPTGQPPLETIAAALHLSTGIDVVSIAATVVAPSSSSPARIDVTTRNALPIGSYTLSVPNAVIFSGGQTHYVQAPDASVYHDLVNGWIGTRFTVAADAGPGD